MENDVSISVEAALQAQNALRASAGQEPEMFPIPAFVGMISDEIERLRQLGRSDGDIAGIICENSPIRITEWEIAQYYAPPEARRAGHGAEKGPAH